MLGISSQQLPDRASVPHFSSVLQLSLGFWLLLHPSWTPLGVALHFQLALLCSVPFKENQFAPAGFSLDFSGVCHMLVSVTETLEVTGQVF